MKQKIIIGLLLLIAILFLVGCTKSVSEIKSEDYVGKTVSVSGEAVGVIKIGQLSGYTLVDSDGNKIGVASEELPSEGDKVTVKGVVMKDTLLGYYIKVN